LRIHGAVTEQMHYISNLYFLLEECYTNFLLVYNIVYLVFPLYFKDLLISLLQVCCKASSSNSDWINGATVKTETPANRGTPVPQIHLGQFNALRIRKEELLASFQDFLKFKAVKNNGDFFL